MYDANTSLKQFLEETAKKQATPGGGSVTALAGALAAAMGEMVLNYSIGKKELAQYESELRPALEEMSRARNMLLELMTEDQTAYEAVAAARKLPAGSPQRKQQEPAALMAAIRGPQAMAATAVAILGVVDRIANFVNYHLLSDLAVCADLAMATTRCAIYNVRVNISDALPPEDRRKLESFISRMLSEAGMLIQQVSPRIWARHAQGV